MTTTVQSLERLADHTKSIVRGAEKRLNGIPADLKERAGFDGESSAGRIRPKWAWHYSVLLNLRERLLKALSERLADVAEPLEPHSMNLTDVTTDEFDHTFAASELSAEQGALYEVDEALRRIADRTYGICEETGRPIPAAHLKCGSMGALWPGSRGSTRTQKRHQPPASGRAAVRAGSDDRKLGRERPRRGTALICSRRGSPALCPEVGVVKTAAQCLAEEDQFLLNRGRHNAGPESFSSNLQVSMRD